jgi:parallel beta-helix repeat protein
MCWYPLFLFVGMLFLLGFNTSRGTEPAAGERWYVSESGSDSLGDGSRDNPFVSIMHAISMAVQFDTVIVLPGRYLGDIGLDSSKFVHLRSEDGAAVTTIDGGISYAGVSPDIRVLLRGFRIVNGVPGVRADSVSPDIFECEIDSCTSGSSSNGSGIVLMYSLATITDCSITNCTALNNGGGMYFYESAPRIVNCRILGNTANTGYGGGIYADSNSISTRRPLIANCVIIGNESDKGGGIYSAGNELVFNNLVADNNVSGTGSGILIEIGASSEIHNNIIAFNLGEGIRCESPVDGTTGYNCFFGNGGEDLVALCHDLGGNVFADPLFVDYSAGNYHLKETSPCINSGLNLDSLPPVDFDDQTRISQDTVDIGPDEYVNCTLSADFSAIPTSGCPMLSVRFNALIEGDYDSLYWDFGDGSDTTNVTQIFHTYTDVGVYTVSMYAITSCTTAVVVKKNLIDIDEAPTANFYVDVDSGCAPLVVQFTDFSDGDPNSWLWDFGDESTSVLPSPVHEYIQGGDYTVTLTVTNNCNEDVLIVQNLIRVGGNAEVDFSALPVLGIAPLTVQFSDGTENDPLEWMWDFGDGFTSSEQNPVHTYLKPGIYDVILSAVNACGVYDTLTRSEYVTVTGFKTVLLDTTDDRFFKTFSILYDTLYGFFNRDIHIEVDTIDLPQRGGVHFVLSNYQVNVFDTVVVTASLSEDMSPGVFRHYLISTADGDSQIDTILIEIESNPITLISASDDTLRFDSTQVGSVSADTVLIHNVSDSSELFISSITILGSAAFDVTWNPGTIYHTSQMLLPVTFTPPDTGEHSATMEIVSDDPVMPVIEVFLSGLAIPERVMPTVIYHDPPHLAVDVPFDTVVSIDLSEEIEFESSPVDSLVTVESEINGGPVHGQLEYIPDRWTLRFIPDMPFEPLDLITVKVSGDIVDLAGNSLDGNQNGTAEGSPNDDTTFSFRTGPGVYPGDANNDGVVNEIDVLPIGVFWMMEGAVRQGDNAEWRMFPALPWDSLGATYADCDGNGVVNEDDLFLIGVHWGQTHDHARLVFAEDGYDLRRYRSAFEAMYLSMSGAPDNEANRRVRNILSRYITEDVGPSNFILSQNYPNPFNPTTYIQYNMPVECHVTLTIHNILGQTVAVLVDEYQPAGYKRVSWNGTADSGENLPSGIYFYRLTAGSFSQVGKMMMLR